MREKCFILIFKNFLHYLQRPNKLIKIFKKNKIIYCWNSYLTTTRFSVCIVKSAWLILYKVFEQLSSGVKPINITSSNHQPNKTIRSGVLGKTKLTPLSLKIYQKKTNLYTYNQ